MKTPAPKVADLKTHAKRLAALSQRLYWAVPVSQEEHDDTAIHNAEAVEAVYRYAISFADWMAGSSTPEATGSAGTAPQPP